MGKYETNKNFISDESRISKTIDRLTSPLGRIAAVAVVGAGLYYILEGGDGTTPEDNGFPENRIYATPIVETPESATVFVVPAPDGESQGMTSTEDLYVGTPAASEID